MGYCIKYSITIVPVNEILQPLFFFIFDIGYIKSFAQGYRYKFQNQYFIIPLIAWRILLMVQYDIYRGPTQ